MFLENEKPIPHDIYTSLISERIKDEDCTKVGWLLDGFPCTPQEFEAFQTLEVTCDALVFLDVPTPVLLARVGDRRKDPNTLDSLEDAFLAPEVQVQGRLVQEEADTARNMSQRIEEYFGDMPEVLNFFHDQLIHINGNRGVEFVKDEILNRLRRAVHRQVIFVVGGPGSGKRTHCDMIATNEGYAHLCPKELINQEQYFDSDISNEIDRITSRGQDIPSSIIVQLLAAAMSKAESNKFIIDSFPRNVDDLDCWYEMMSKECILDFVIHLQCPKTIVHERSVLKKEASLQSISSISSITKKYKQFCEDSLPFVNKMHHFGRARVVSTASPISVASKQVSRLVRSLSLIPPYERSLCIVKPDAVNNGNVPAILTAINDSHMAIVFTRFVTMTKEVVDDFFSNSPLSKSKSFKKHRDHLKSGPSLLIVVEGSSAIRRLQELIGDEKTFKSQPITLRSQFGTDSVRNAFYCSATEFEVIRDISYWMCVDEGVAKAAQGGSAGCFSVEETLALIKPTFAESCYDDIIAIIAGHGFEIISECRFRLTPVFLSELYPEMKADQEYSKAREYMLSGPVVALQLRRNSALKGWRHLIGCINLKKTQEERYDSIRSMFAISSIENAVHGSYNSLMANKELGLFFPMLKYGDTSPSKTEKPKTAKKKKRKQQPSSSVSKPSALHSYLSQDVNPVLNDLVRNLAIQKPKDIMGYAINELIEKQKMDVHKIGSLKKKISLSSSVPVLPNLNFDHHTSSEKSATDGLPLESTDRSGQMSLEVARVEIARLQETITALSANIIEESDVKRPTRVHPPSAAPTVKQPNVDKVLNILSLGDFVGFGNNQDDLLEGNTMACLSATIKKCKDSTNALVLFTGNFLGCSHTIDSTHYSSLISLVDNLGINYGILGNRDFEFGWEDAHNHLKFSLVTWIASNIVKPETNQPFKNCEEKVLIEWNGIQVGLIGIVDDWLTNSPACADSVKVLDPFETSKRLCCELKDEGAEVILIMSHCEDQQINEDMAGLPDVQVVLSGHERRFRSWQLNSSSMGVANGGLAGISSVSIRVEDNELPVVSWPPNYVVVSTDQQPYDIIDSVVSNLREESEANSLTKLGTTAVTLSGQKQILRTSETNLGNLLTDIMRQFSKSSIAVLNAGAIRFDGDISPGIITIGDILTMLPHNDYVATVTLTGEQILDMLNNSVSRAPSADGRFLQVSGLTFEYRVDTLERGRCFNVHVGNQAMNLGEEYTCSLPGWLLEQHDGYKKCFEGVTLAEAKEFCPSLIQVVYSYFEKKMLSKANRYYRELTEDDFDSVEAGVEGRITPVSTSYYATSSNLGEETHSRSGGSVSSDIAVARHPSCDDDEYEDEEEEIDYGTPSDNVLSSKF
jgi:2',3'-cyclic-nucleotide 2'-phosphodiesterase (5'-nucleotidase family)/nucleoside diphosphate kinase/adenylate kinase family enzyme